MSNDRELLEKLRRLKELSSRDDVHPQAATPVTKVATVEKSLLEKGADAITPWWIKSIIPKVDTNSKSEMFNNIPSSAGDLAKGVYDAASHPIETAKGIGNLGLGVVEKLIPGEQSHEQYANNFSVILKDRYGGIDNIKNTAINDPSGMMLDLSVIPTAGSTATAGTMKLASKVIPESTPVNMMEKAINFRPTVNKFNPNNKREITRTIINEQIDPTNAKGLDKSYSNISNLNNKVDGMIDNVPKTYALIKKKELLSGVQEVRDQFTGVQFKGKKNKQVIDKALKDFDDHLDFISKKDNFTLDDIQGLKKGLYKDLEDAFKKSDFTGAEERLMQNIANKAKESIEKIIPEVKETNARLGKHYQMMEELPTIVNKMENYRGVGADMFFKAGTGGMVGGSMGGAVGGFPGATIGSGIGTGVGATAGLLSHPRVRAKNALMLERMRNSGDYANKLFSKQKIPLAAQGLLYSGQMQ